MKKTFFAMALLLCVSTAFAATTQKWNPGWDQFTEPLNYQTSKVAWSVNPTTKKLTVTLTLRGATPTKLYQGGIVFFCTTFPSTFGQFPVIPIPPNCETLTKQNVTKTIAASFFGAVLTDINGNGSVSILIGPVASGTYDVEFVANDGVGCYVNGGGGNGNCVADFQSPGPTFGDTIQITVP